MQLENDCCRVQVRKRQSTAEQQQRAAKQQRDKKVQRRDAESMQDDQDVSGNDMTAHCSPEFADLKECYKQFTHQDCPAHSVGHCCNAGTALFYHIQHSCRMHSCVSRSESTLPILCTQQPSTACTTSSSGTTQRRPRCPLKCTCSVETQAVQVLDASVQGNG